MIDPPPPAPLPPLTLRSATIDTDLERTVYRQARLAWGDLILTADTFTLHRTTGRGEAAGHVVLIRGDETIRGRRFFLDRGEGIFEVEEASLLSPPLWLASARLHGADGEFVADDAQIAPDARSREVRLFAREARVDRERQLRLRDVSVQLYGLRFLTLRRLTLRLPDPSQDRGDHLRFPTTFRLSRISGIAVGMGLPFRLSRQARGEFVLEPMTRQGFQFEGSAGIELRPSSLAAPAAPALSPLRQLLAARPLPPLPDPVERFAGIFSTSPLIPRPVIGEGRTLRLDLRLSGNREIGTRRQGDLTLSRLPEFAARYRHPLFAPAGARRRALRPVLSAEANAGWFVERRLEADRRTIGQPRAALTVGAGIEPLLLGDRLLLRAQVAVAANRYGTGQSYRFAEEQLLGEWLLGERSAIGGGVILRQTHGATPFLFDQQDTGREGQLRLQFALPGTSWIVGSFHRYDLTQGRAFDNEVALAFAGRMIEPRLSFRTINQQIGFTVAFPNLRLP